MARASEHPRVFLSYAREDLAAAERLYRELSSFGLRVWWDRRSLTPGSDWDLAIRQGIEGSDYFVALLSKNSVGKRGTVQREIRRALSVLEDLPEESNYLIPVRLDDCRPGHAQLLQRQWVDLFPDWEQGFAEVLRALGVDLGSLEATNRRLLWAMGLFRHRLIGPVQGIVSAARVLADRAHSLVPVDSEVQELLIQIEQEAEALRLQRLNHGYLASARVGAQREFLNPVRCMEGVVKRYAPILARRQVTLRLIPGRDREVRLFLDESSFDLALSNLLENAARYAYYGTAVTVRVTTTQKWLEVVVENLGNAPLQGTLESLGDSFSFREQDLTSWLLDGRGFGLRVVGLVAALHGGRLLGESRRIESSKGDRVKKESTDYKTADYLVRFIMKLPISSDESTEVRGASRDGVPT